MNNDHIHWDKKVSALTLILRDIFGDEVWDDNPQRTAERVLEYWCEYADPYQDEFELTTFPADVNQLIVVNNIEFSSICAHHLLPFWGIAHVGYIPNEEMVGLSKIPRMVDYLARQPRTQERLTSDIASYLKHELAAMGVAVVMIAKHTCMACRGVRKHNGHMTTSEMRGVFLTSGEARSEFLHMINSEVAL